LTELKSELGMLRDSKEAGRSEPSSPGRRAADEDEDVFEEEEDETIALTGEELDNILTTADIKEEKKTETATEQEEETELDIGEDILSYEEASPAEDQAFEVAGEESSDSAEKSFAPVEESPEIVEESFESVEESSGPVEGSPEIAEESPESVEEEISFDEVVSDEPLQDNAEEIEIEIPELADEGGEVPELENSEDLETLDELESTAGPVAGETASDELETIPPLDDLDTSVDELAETPVTTTTPAASADAPAATTGDMQLPPGLKEEIKSVLGYMDQLLESLPEEKIEEFAKSEYFAIYKKLFEELGLVS
jgi:hypothetical protein